MHSRPITEGKDGYWRTYLPDASKPNNRRLIKKRTKEAVIQEVVAYYQQESENPTIEEMFNEWNDHRLELGKIADSTHLRNQQEFTRHYDTFGKRKIKSVTPDELEDFLENEIARFNLTAKAFSNLKAISKGFLLRAKKQQLISFNVTELFDDMDVSDRSFKKTIKEDYQEVFNDEETEIIMNYLIDNFDIWNAGILLLFLTGIRIGELVTLKHSDFGGNTIKIRRTESRYRENGKDVYIVKEFPKSKAGVRTAVVPTAYTSLLQRIYRLNPFSEYLFVNNGNRIKTHSIRNRLKLICKKLGIYPKSPHKVRKTYGSILLDNNVDKRLIQDLMGHTDISITENYYHRNRKQMHEKVKIISELPEFMAK